MRLGSSGDERVPELQLPTTSMHSRLEHGGPLSLLSSNWRYASLEVRQEKGQPFSQPFAASAIRKELHAQFELFDDDG